MKVWMMRLGAALMVATVAASAGYFAGAQNQPAAQRTLKTNQVARVGERVITAEQMIQRIIDRERTIMDPDLRTARWAIDSLVIEEMLSLEADRIGARPGRVMITNEYDALMKDWERDFQAINAEIVRAQRARGMQEKPWSRDEFIEQKHNMTMPEFESYMKALARQNVLVRMVVNYWRIATINARADAIFMRSEKDLQKVHDRLMKGEKFDVLAGEFSEDLITRQQGGFLGKVYPKDGTLDPAVEEEFWNLQPGRTSKVIKTDRGYWIIRKSDVMLPNEAEFFNLQQQCLDMTHPDNGTFLKWRHAVAASGRYAYEERIPGVHVRTAD